MEGFHSNVSFIQKLGAKVTWWPALKWKLVGMVDMQMTALKKATTSTEMYIDAGEQMLIAANHCG